MNKANIGLIGIICGEEFWYAMETATVSYLNLKEAGLI